MEEATAALTPLATVFTPELNVDLEELKQNGTGIYYEILTPGSGAAIAPGETAVVHYTGLPTDQS